VDDRDNSPVIHPVAAEVGGISGWARTGTPLALFVTLGLPAGALGVAWPHMRASLGAPLAGLGLLLAAVTVAYFLASATSGPLAARLGGATLLISGCALAAIGLIALSLAAWWWMVPVVGLLVGAGSGLIDAAVNTHVSLNRGVRYMGLLHASWALGAALGPQVVVVSIATTSSWRAAFAAAGVAFLLSGLAVASRGHDWIRRGEGGTDPAPKETAPPPAYRRAMVLMAAVFLLGAGLEATAGDWSYSQLTLGRLVPADLASWGATLFWAGLAGGRVALGVLGHRFTPTRLLDGGIGVSAFASLAFWLGPPLVSTFIALPLLGMAVSVIFPLLLSLTPSRVGPGMTAHAVGYGLAAGTIGGGGLPAATGLVLQSAGLLTLGPIMTAMAALLLLLHAASRVAASRSA
jgi:fucose permease